MINVSSAFNWAGDRILASLLGELDQRMHRAGQKFVSVAQSLAHVETGQMRAGVFYRVENRTLILGDTVGWSVFEEFGTRFRPPHPFMRPALLQIGPTLGFDLNLEFTVPHIASPLLHHRGTYVAPSGIQPRPLTQAQHRHVREHLMPSARKLHKGNVKRAKMVVKRLGI